MITNQQKAVLREKQQRKPNKNLSSKIMMETSFKAIGFTSYLSDFITNVYLFFNYLMLLTYLYVLENLLLSRYETRLCKQFFRGHF